MFDEKNIRESTRLIAGGIFLNIFLTMVKITVGVLGNSFALVADGIESATDIFSSIIVYLGLKTASKAPDEDHPYGHGRAESLAAIIVCVFLIGAAFLIATQAVHNILTPHKLPKPFTLYVLLVVIVLKESLYRRMNKSARQLNSTAVQSDAWHHRSDAITALAASIGISIALVKGPGYEMADDWAALVAAGIILFNAIRIFKPAFDELMDRAPDESFILEVRALAKQVPGVIDIDKCFVRKSGFEVFIDIHLIVDGDMNVREGHRIGHAVKDHIKSKIPAVFDVLTHIEPFARNRE